VTVSRFVALSVSLTRKLSPFQLTTFLTKRDAWSGNFEELLLDAPRPDSDCPMHLPDAPKPSTPWTAPPATLPVPYNKSEICITCADPKTAPLAVCRAYCRDPDSFAHCDHCPAILEAETETDADSSARRRLADGSPAPEHCGLQEQTCRGLGVANVRQKRFIKLYSRLTLTPEPDYDALDFDAAEEWLADRWQEWSKQGNPIR